MLSRFWRKKAVFLVTLHFKLSLHFVPGLQSAVCILYLVCILYPVCSLQSAVCILYWPVLKRTVVGDNSSFQNYTHLDDHTIRTRYIFLLMLESSGAIELPKCSTIHVSIGERENGTKWLFSSTIHVSIGRSSLRLCVLRASADEWRSVPLIDSQLTHYWHLGRQ